MKRTSILLAGTIVIALIAAATIAAQGRTSAKRIGAAELEKLLADSASKTLLVDVRTAEEFAAGHIPGSVLFPYDQMDRRAADFRKLAGAMDRSIVVYCRSGRRSAIAAETLVKLGFTDVADFGAIGNWRGHLER